MEAGEARTALEAAGLSPVLQGDGDAVTAQLPGPDTALEEGSQVLLYLGRAVPDAVTVPDFSGMTPEQAAQAAAQAGVTIRCGGNTDPSARVQFQDLPAGQAAEPGCTVTITLTDPTAHD